LHFVLILEGETTCLNRCCHRTCWPRFVTLFFVQSLRAALPREPNSISNAIDYAKFRSRSHDVVIRVYDEAGNVIETHEHKGEFKEW
jgi:hypothetical protein